MMKEKRPFQTYSQTVDMVVTKRKEIVARVQVKIPRHYQVQTPLKSFLFYPLTPKIYSSNILLNKPLNPYFVGLTAYLGLERNGKTA